MSAEPATRGFDIGYVLFIDIVGYSKLSGEEQKRVVRQLNETVRTTPEFQRAEAAGRLLRLPAGDGMALVFFASPEAPVQCALEISGAFKQQPHMQVRMGVNSGPIDQVEDVNDRSNISGAGINMAQRVMSCGDAGHILVAKRVADDLAQYEKWRRYLHELGEVEVKHGLKIDIVNLCSDGIGNSELPNRIKESRRIQKVARRRRVALGGALLLIASLLLWAVYYQAQKRKGALATIPEKSIAVLPFQNLSPDPQNAFFADGVQDEILTDLARIADLKVISRTSVMQYKPETARNARAISQALGVANLLEGSVQREGGKVRVNVQLIDARSDTHIWAQTYDRDLADIFAIQSEIATTIVDQLRAKISPSEKHALDKPVTTDLAAYDLYLRALALYADTTDTVHARVKLPKAAELLDEASTRDPQFLAAFCLLAKIHTTIYWQGFDHTPARLDRANAAVQAALRLQPESGEAHLALADYYYRAFRDYQKALVHLTLARRSLPNNPDVFAYSGYIKRRQGHWVEATRDLERAVELDPRNFLILQQLAITYQAQRRYKEQAVTYDRALGIIPGDPITRMARAAVALDAYADVRPIQETFARIVAEDPSVISDIADVFSTMCERNETAVLQALEHTPPEGTLLNGFMCPRAYWEGAVALWRKDFAKASQEFQAARADVEQALAKQPDFPAALSVLGMIDAGLGRKEEAIREGERACELMPVSKDALDGSAFEVNLAQIYSWLGEKDLAIEQIEKVERSPNYLTYGFLKLHPFWDPLRGDPRFEKLVASLAPKG
ncbi:MAG TPA: tetratricopeptide repeat protein [Candidatus Udaeobacter sp.]|nr:tetratricopeptide repeat protein [Candidatus Udaeobacter sp.]